jgi:hypothetical protein
MYCKEKLVSIDLKFVENSFLKSEVFWLPDWSKDSSNVYLMIVRRSGTTYIKPSVESVRERTIPTNRSNSSVVLKRLKWTPFQNHYFSEKSGSAGNRTRDLWICSQEL